MSQRPFTARQNDPRRRSLIIGTNTKLHHTAGETVAYLRQLHAKAPDAVQSTSGVQLFLCPPYTSLPAAVPTAAQIDVPIWIGAQNVDGHLDGAFTGEISAPMLSALGTDLVLLGHAERRNLFGETNESLARKVRVAMDSDLLIMLCVGEKADDREHRVGPETVRRQVKIALSGISADRLNRVLIAYEPVWGHRAAPRRPGRTTSSRSSPRSPRRSTTCSARPVRMSRCSTAAACRPMRSESFSMVFRTWTGFSSVGSG